MLLSRLFFFISLSLQILSGFFCLMTSHILYLTVSYFRSSKIKTVTDSIHSVKVFLNFVLNQEQKKPWSKKSDFVHISQLWWLSEFTSQSAMRETVLFSNLVFTRFARPTDRLWYKIYILFLRIIFRVFKFTLNYVDF